GRRRSGFLGGRLRSHSRPNARPIPCCVANVLRRRQLSPPFPSTTLFRSLPPIPRQCPPSLRLIAKNEGPFLYLADDGRAEAIRPPDANSSGLHETSACRPAAAAQRTCEID